MALQLSGEWDNFLNNSQTVDWRFNYQDEPWRCEANEIGENQIKKEEENHFYQKENCPSGANFFASLSRPIFVNEESIDKDKNVAWRFNFGDNGFRQRALTVPSCVHVKEMELHEYHKKNAKFDQKNYVMNKKPAPILKPVDCIEGDDSEPSKPPVRLVPPCLPCLPPLPPPACCIPYPNALTEKEWHNIHKEVAEMSQMFNEGALYERSVKTCDPCMLPQSGKNGRFYARPGMTLENKMDPNEPGKTKEDEGECAKRETRGPGIYRNKGWLPSASLCMPGDVPCGYYFSEKLQHTYCTSGGGGGGGGEEAKAKPSRAPPPPPCPPKVICPNPMPSYYTCPPRQTVPCCSPCCGPC